MHCERGAVQLVDFVGYWRDILGYKSSLDWSQKALSALAFSWTQCLVGQVLLSVFVEEIVAAHAIVCALTI